MSSLGGDWWEYVDPAGTPYYYNSKSRVTQWDKPPPQPPTDIPPPPPPQTPSTPEVKRRRHRKTREKPEKPGDKGGKGEKDEKDEKRHRRHRRAPISVQSTSADQRSTRSRSSTSISSSSIFVDLSPRLASATATSSSSKESLSNDSVFVDELSPRLRSISMGHKYEAPKPPLALRKSSERLLVSRPVAASNGLGGLISPRHMVSLEGLSRRAGSDRPRIDVSVDRKGPSDAYERKRAESQSAYTKAIVKPINVAEKSPEQQYFYRQMLLGELLDTEIEHWQHMKFVCLQFVGPAGAVHILSKEQIDRVFANIHEVRDASEGLMRALTAQLTPGAPHYECVGNAFRAQLPAMSAAYVPFCVSSETNQKYFDNLCKEQPDIAAFFADLLRAPGAELFSLASYLIKPVQRIMKYPMLLAELLRYTPENSPDHAPLVAAHAEAKALAHDINAKKRDDEGRRRWADIASSIETDAEFDVVGDKRALFLEADLQCAELERDGNDLVLASLGTRRVWLCNDVLLVGKSTGRKHSRLDHVFLLVPDASAVSLRTESADGNVKEFAFSLQVKSFAHGTNPLVFGFKGMIARDQWYAALQAQLREGLENQRQRRALGEDGAVEIDFDARMKNAVKRGSTAKSLAAMSEDERNTMTSQKRCTFISAEFLALTMHQRRYCDELTTLVSQFINPLQKQLQHSLAADIASLFAHINAIRNVHTQMVLPCLTKVAPTATTDEEAATLLLTVCDAVGAISEGFDGYTRYAAIGEPAMIAIEAENRPGTRFREVIQELTDSRDVSHDGLDFMGLLRNPRKHLAEMVAMVERVGSCLPEQKLVHTLPGALRAAAFGMVAATTTVSHLAATMTSSVNSTRLKLIAQRLQGVPGDKPIVAPGRKFVTDGEMKVGGKAYFGWVFSDRFVYGKLGKKGAVSYKGEFDLKTTLIRNVIDSKSIANAFELVHVTAKESTPLVCSMLTPKAKHDTMTAISAIIKGNMTTSCGLVRVDSTASPLESDVRKAAPHQGTATPVAFPASPRSLTIAPGQDLDALVMQRDSLEAQLRVLEKQMLVRAKDASLMEQLTRMTLKKSMLDEEIRKIAPELPLEEERIAVVNKIAALESEWGRHMDANARQQWQELTDRAAAIDAQLALSPRADRSISPSLGSLRRRRHAAPVLAPPLSPPLSSRPPTVAPSPIAAPPIAPPPTAPPPTVPAPPRPSSPPFRPQPPPGAPSSSRSLPQPTAAVIAKASARAKAIAASYTISPLLTDDESSADDADDGDFEDGGQLRRSRLGQSHIP